MSIYQRTEALLGIDGVEKLKRSTVAVFGLGGVGSYAVEALARAGVGHLVLVDSDRVSQSNINRQLIALTKTVGELKTDVEKARVNDINPDIKVDAYPIFFSSENAEEFDFENWDYIIDAIDSVASKLCLIETAKKKNVKIISSMGTGNKLDPTMLEVSDISKTSVCPLAKTIRVNLRKMGINKLKVVYSKEEPIPLKTDLRDEKKETKRVPGSVSFVPSVAGLILAGEVIKDLVF